MKSSQHNERYQAQGKAKLMKTANHGSATGMPPLPQIPVKGAQLHQFTQQTLGHRRDENCNLDRKVLMMEKANRLGEQFTLKNKPTDGVDKMYANAASKGPINTRQRNSHSMVMRTEED